MKRIIIFLIMILCVICPLTEEQREEIRKKRKEHETFIAECILRSPQASADIKKRIEENKEEDLRNVLHPKDHKYEKTDREVIRNCRREYIDKLRERRMKDRENRGPKIDDNLRS